MMDREHGAQQKMLCVTMESLMPEKQFSSGFGSLGRL